ncbi:hypothetical protein AB1283_00970 [Bacillus sp. S13(2024)]
MNENTIVIIESLCALILTGTIPVAIGYFIGYMIEVGIRRIKDNER